MNKKVMSSAVIILMISMLIVSIFGINTVSAKQTCRSSTVDKFTATPFVDPPTMTNMKDLEPGSEKYVCEGTIRIAQGNLRQCDYNGPLGAGTLFFKTVYSIMHVEIPNSISIGIGYGIYQYTLVLDNGPYGSGTLKGIAKLNWDYNINEFSFETWDTAKLFPVDGNLNIKWVSVEGYTFFFDWWWTTTIIVS